MQIEEVDDSTELEYEFLADTLKLFDKILKTTTLTLWAHNIRSTQQTNAVNNLKARLTALETINATQATAFAIARATEELNEKSSQDEHKEIRLSNLEKKFKSYEQKTNEIANKIRKKTTKTNFKKTQRGLILQSC